MTICIGRALLLVAVCLLSAPGAGCTRDTSSQSDRAGLSSDDYAKVRETIARELAVPVDQLDDEKPLYQQVEQFDAITVIEIVLALEQQFDVTISDEAVERYVGSSDVGRLRERATVKNLAEALASALPRRQTR